MGKSLNIKIESVTNPNGTVSYRAKYGGVTISTTTMEEAQRILIDMVAADGYSVQARTDIQECRLGFLVVDVLEANDVPWWTWPSIVEATDAVINRLRTSG